MRAQARLGSHSRQHLRMRSPSQPVARASVSLCVFQPPRRPHSPPRDIPRPRAYLNMIKPAAPWVPRYLAVAAVLSRRAQARRAVAAVPISLHVQHAIREVVKVVQPEEYQYSDPVTKFLKELHVAFDFEAAQRELRLAECVVGNDFLLSEIREEFLDDARYLINET
ncbi:hypothetical protein F5148DRAFT_69309 [Russula earlei]|uniref:Uncharacterized protein n=1 Tax=Russula earlei TaxID=71964 RepID=A0ACC0TS46_9AGAM|nr:hypothetical protein F5148DRAFT_69309 [Russula earlei]